MSRLLLLVLGICLLLTLAGCTEPTREVFLEHPAITLLNADRSIGIFDPTWSPDGKRLAVTGVSRCFTGRCPEEVYVLDVASDELYRIVTSGSHPAWTSDPEVVSFVESGNIHTVDLEGNNPTTFADGLLASWSSDGKYVAIMRQNREDGPEADITLAVDVLDIASGEERRVFETPQGADEDFMTRLAWSPDSAQIAVTASWWTPQTAYTGGVLVVNVDGTNLRNVSTSATEAGWMPDGDWLYFLIDDGQLGFAPLSFNCVLTPLEITDVGDPVISPSGERMAFLHNGNMYLLNLDRLLGTNREELVCPNE